MRFEILILTLLGFLLRIYHLESQSYWIDEGWSVYFANLSFSDMLNYLQTNEPHPPLYYPVLIYWVKMVGDSEYALRFYSLIFGVLAIPLSYRLGEAIEDKRLGFLTALLMAIAPFQVWHAQEARMYTVLTAASLMSMWGFVRLIKGLDSVSEYKGFFFSRQVKSFDQSKHENSKSYIFFSALLYIIGTEWAILTHYHGFVLIGIQGLFLLLTAYRHWRKYFAWGTTLLLIFLLYLPWVLYSWDLLKDRISWIEQPTLWQTYLRSTTAYSIGQFVPQSEATWLILPFVALYGLGLLYVVYHNWARWHGLEMLAFLVAFTLAPNFATWLYGEFRTTIYFERYLIMVQPGYLMTISIGILAIYEFFKQKSAHFITLRLRRVLPTTVSAIALLSIIAINSWVLQHHYFNPSYAKADWRTVARVIEDFDLSGDGIILTGYSSEVVFNYYYKGDAPIYLDFNVFPTPSEEEAHQLLSDMANKHRRLWYVPYGTPIDSVLQDWLLENTQPASKSWLGKKQLFLYGSQLDQSQQEKTLEANFNQTLTLNSVILPDQESLAGDLLPLTLNWRMNADLPNNVNVSLRLMNKQGDIFAQSDWPPLSKNQQADPVTLTDLRALWLPADIPPGNYVLQIVAYNQESDQSLIEPITIQDIPIGAARLMPSLASLSIPNPTQQSLDQLNVVGYVAPENIQPGQDMWLWVYWQAQKALDPQTKIALHIGDSSEQTMILSLADSVGPLASWQPSQVRKAIYHIPSNPHLTGEEAPINITLINTDKQPELQVSLTTIKLENRARQFDMPSMNHSVDLAFGSPNQLKLIGYDLPTTTLTSNQTLPITFYWQAIDEMEINYTVFIQLLNDVGEVVSQIDSPPLANQAPTTTWLAGEILTDPYSLSLNDLPSGDYRLIAGLYNATTGERLPIASGNDFIQISPITINP